jgi:catechol 2,3-dioxygenase-like lactoylglutathione lyase family enzyme
MTAMDITIRTTFLPHDDPDASLAFYRDTLGFEVRNDVAYGGMRWITVGPAARAQSGDAPAAVWHRLPGTEPWTA